MAEQATIILRLTMEAFDFGAVMQVVPKSGIISLFEVVTLDGVEQSLGLLETLQCARA